MKWSLNFGIWELMKEEVHDEELEMESLEEKVIYHGNLNQNGSMFTKCVTTFHGQQDGTIYFCLSLN